MKPMCVSVCVCDDVSVQDRMQSVWTRVCPTESAGVQEEGET